MLRLTKYALEAQLEQPVQQDQALPKLTQPSLLESDVNEANVSPAVTDVAASLKNNSRVARKVVPSKLNFNDIATVPDNTAINAAGVANSEAIAAEARGSEKRIFNPTPRPVNPQPNDQVSLRSFSDSSELRKAIFDRVQNSINTLAPISNKKYTLQFKDAHYIGPEVYKPKDIKRAILEQGSLTRKLQATAVLTNLMTGEVEEKPVIAARVPYMLDDCTFMRSGTRYVVKNQMRLRSGIFTQAKKNGEISSHINTDAKQGASHKYDIDPKTGVFYMQLAGTKTPLITFLRALGVSESDMKDAWGSEVYAANAKKANPADTVKYYNKFVREKDRVKTTDLGTMERIIRESAAKIKFDPVVTQQTIGAPLDTYGPQAALLTTKKLLNVFQGKAKEDDRDNIAFQHIWGPEDFFENKIARSDHMQRAMLNKITYLKKGLIDLSPEPFSKPIDDAIMTTGLGQPNELINNLQTLNTIYGVSRMGEGGIPDENTIPEQARQVNMSQRGFIDTILTPSSGHVGVDLYFSDNIKKGSDKNIYAPFINAKTGATEWLRPQDVTFKTTAVKSEYDNATDFMPIVRNNELVYGNKNEVEYLVPNFEHTFSPLPHMIPMKQALKGQRMSMGARMMTQALPMTNGETPLVQTIDPDDKEHSFDEKYGTYVGAIRADMNGKVQSVTPDELTIKYEDGSTKTYDLTVNEPSNRKTYMDQTPVVKVGDVVAKGGLLVRSNQTDANGNVALGMNLKVAFLPWKGYNFNDGFAVSESCAKKLKSEHMYQNKLEWLDRMEGGRNKFIAIYPSTYNKDQLSKIGEDGVIKPGSIVNTGDPLVLALNQTELGVKRVHSKGKRTYSNATLLWDHHDQGVVTDVLNTSKGAVVIVKSASELKTGDKLSTKFGTKGVVNNIIPDDEMPKMPDGSPVEMLIHPGSTMSRINPAILLENQLGKIAKKIGKPIKIEDWGDKDLVDYVVDLSKKYNVPIGEALTDPETGKIIKNEDGTGVQVGYSYILKLHHMAEAKGSVRGLGGYASDDTPSRGGPNGSRRWGMQATNALLAHGAYELLKDARDVRGQRNDDYWMAYMQGRTPIIPKENFKRDKFFYQLKAAGVNIVPEDGRFTLMAMTDKDVQKLAEDREVTNSETINWEKGKKPIAKGLFDEGIFGEYGQKWGQITLNHPIPNPVFEGPIVKILGITLKQFDAVMNGKEQLGTYGTGIGAIKQALDKIDLKKEMSKSKQELSQVRGLKRDAVVQRIKYIQGAIDANIHPREWIISKIPVLPPKFRPIAEMNDGTPLINDMNYLYKNILDINNSYRELGQYVASDPSEGPQIYQAYKEVAGLADPANPKLKEMEVTGLLDQIFGKGNSKFSTVQSELLSNNVELGGRGTVVADPELDMDSIGIPEESAWKIFAPFVIRKIVKRGHKISDAKRYIEEKHPLAVEALMDVMDERPLVSDRAPLLHKYGILAFKPRVVADDTIHMNPFVDEGFGLDHDGDSILSTVNLELKKDFFRYLLANSELAVKYSLFDDIRYAMKDAENRSIIEKSMVNTGNGEVAWLKKAENLCANNLCVPIQDVPVVDGSEVQKRENCIEWDVAPGVYIHTVDKETREIKLLPITKKSLHKDLDMYDVTLGGTKNYKRVMTVSKENSIITYKDGKLVAASIDEAIGCLSPRIEQDKALADSNKYAATTIYIGARIFLTADVAIFIGAMIGDSWVDDYCNTRMKSNYNEFRSKLMQIVVDANIPVGKALKESCYLDMIRFGDSNTSCIDFKLTSEAASDLQGLIGHGAQNKRIPYSCLNSTKDVLIGLLVGLLSTNGTVRYKAATEAHKCTYKTVTYATTSPILRDQVVFLCEKLGIHTSVYAYTGNHSTVPCYKIGMSIFDIVFLYKNNCGFRLIQKEKQDKLEKMAKEIMEVPSNSSDLELVPYPMHIASELSCFCYDSVISKSRHSTYKKRGWLPRTVAKKMVLLIKDGKPDWNIIMSSQYFPKEYRKLHVPTEVKKLVDDWCSLVENSAIKWDYISDVKYHGKMDAWDLTVPGPYTFCISTGAVVQDTMSFHVPAKKEAVEEAYNLLLPSRCILAASDMKTPLQKPMHEFMGGLYMATTADSKNPVKTFVTVQDMRKAYARGEVGLGDKVNILRPDTVNERKTETT